jgi:uncharacterized cupin superfamily protein
MEVHPGIFTSDVDAHDWEPLEAVPGSEFHALVEMDDHDAGLWRIPGEGTMTFRWSTPARDTFLVLEGTARIELDDGPTLDVKAGSIVSLPPGVASTWHVTRPYKDLYVMGGAA